jgi:signal transduction histidine kinase
MVWYSILLALTGLLPLGLAVYAWPRRSEPAVGAFIVAATAGALWPLLLLAEIITPGVEAKSVLVRLRPALILTAASGLFVMALRHGGWAGPRRIYLAALAPMPVVTLILNFLPATSGWFQHGFRLHPRVPQLLAYESGMWAGIYEIYGPLLAFAVVGILLAQAWQRRGVYRRRALLLACGVSAPSILYVFQLLGWTDWTAYNLPPLGMAATGLCSAWVLLRDHSLDLVPVARAAIFEQWRDPVVVVNQRREVMDLNPAAAREMKVEPGVALEQLADPWRELITGIDGRSREAGEVRCGSAVWSYEVQPLADEHSAWQGWALVAQDITERVRARAELESLNRNLEEEIRQRRATEARLLETHRIETIGRLSGGVAHEFNNLTMVITGYSSLLLSRMGEDDENRRALEAIAQAGEDAARLTAQLLEFSRQQVMRADRIDVRMLVREAQHMWGTLLGERVRLKVESEAREGPAWVLSDAPKVRDALTQLILNARDAMREGGVVTVRVEQVAVPRGAVLRTPDFPPGEYVRISVEDTGMGMDAATLSRAMEPFFSTKGVGQGSGLGLSSAYGIARQCGGTLEMESVQGAGTTARMYLPVAEAPEGAAEVGQEVELPARASRILVVEDQEDVRRLLCDLLEADGHEVLEAGGAAAALRILELEQARPRLMVTDLVMPGLSGQELIRRAMALVPELRVLVISGYSEQQCGRADGFLRKPFNPDQLKREVKRLLQPG